MDQSIIFIVKVEKINGASDLVIHRKTNSDLPDELKKLIKEKYRCEATLQIHSQNARSLNFKDAKELQDAGLKLIDIDKQIVNYYKEKEEN